MCNFSQVSKYWSHSTRHALEQFPSISFRAFAQRALLMFGSEIGAKVTLFLVLLGARFSLPRRNIHVGSRRSRSTGNHANPLPSAFSLYVSFRCSRTCCTLSLPRTSVTHNYITTSLEKPRYPDILEPRYLQQQINHLYIPPQKTVDALFLWRRQPASRLTCGLA